MVRQSAESRREAKKKLKIKTSSSSSVVVSNVVSDDNDDKLKKKNKKKMKKAASDIKQNKKDEKLKKKKQKVVTVEDDVHSNQQQQQQQQQTHDDDNMDVAKSQKKVKKAASNKKRKGSDLPEDETIEAVVSSVPDEVHDTKSKDGKRDKKTSKSKKKKTDKESRKKVIARENVAHSDETDQQQSGTLKSTSQIENSSTLFDDEDEVYEMSSGDEDETTGMKRWITKYHRARPGAEVLMENINDFLVDYAAHKEREKKEREEEAAEGGWTVVGQHKGRKKTTEAESGTTVGSVAPAAVMDKLSKKKDKEVGHNFYRFQRREAQRNEIMMLQSKFEQDKKRIQELRAARKFRPY